MIYLLLGQGSNQGNNSRQTTISEAASGADLCHSLENPIVTLSPAQSVPCLIITHIFWDVFMGHGDKPSCIEEAACDLCFGNPLHKRLQKLVGNDKNLCPRAV
jgi:hypothetical protein